MVKECRLVVRLSKYEERQLEQEAERRGVTKSDLIRSYIARLPDVVEYLNTK